MEASVLYAFMVGTRVWIPPGRSSEGLPVRSGTILELQRGGALVRHDDGMLLGWAHEEMRPVEWAPRHLRLWWWLRGMFSRLLGGEGDQDG